MPKSAFVDFKAVKASVSIEQVLDRYGLLDKFKKKGDALTGPCPIHKGSNPTQFRVSISKNIFNCFSECKHGGNVLDLISKMENVSIHGAALKAIEWFKLGSEVMKDNAEEGEERADDRPKKSAPASKPKPQNPKPAPANESDEPNQPLKFKLDNLRHENPYLMERRGLTLETIEEFGLGFFRGEKGLMVGRVVIPIHNVKGELVAYAGRWPADSLPEDTPKYKLPPNFKKGLELFNLDRAVKEPEDKPLVIVEGFFDAIKLHQNGWRKVVALMGSTMSAAQEDLIRTHTNAESRVVLMLDEDDAGRAGREDIAGRLSRFCFVKTHVFAEEGMQPEKLSADELHWLLNL